MGWPVWSFGAAQHRSAKVQPTKIKYPQVIFVHTPEKLAAALAKVKD